MSSQSSYSTVNGVRALRVDVAQSVSTGALTNAELRAAAVPISASSFPLPTGAASEATLAALNTKMPAFGQATMANSTPVVLASNQSAIAVTGTFWQATQPVSIASMPSTPVTGTFWQATQPVSLAAAPTTPVTGTFWQATQPVSAAALPLPSGAATETTLAGVLTTTAYQARQPVQGQALASASVPVVLASDHAELMADRRARQAAEFDQLRQRDAEMLALFGGRSGRMQFNLDRGQR